MKEKREAKASSFSLVTTLMMIFLVIGIVYMNLENQKLSDTLAEKNALIDQKNEQIIALQASKTEENNEINRSISKVDDTKELVYKVGKDFEKSEEEKISGEFPQINLNCETAKNINKKIENNFNEIYNSIISLENLDGFVPFESEFHVDENVISVLIKNKYVTDDISVYVYNINMNTGEVITNEELIKTKGLYRSDLIERIEEYGKEITNKAREQEWEDASNEKAIVWGKAAVGANIDIDNLPIYIDEDGGLSMAVEYYSPAENMNAKTEFIKLK